MPIVSNSSPLIWLSKIGKISLLEHLFGEVVIPEEVYKEVDERGLNEGLSDALILKECVNQGWIKVSKLDERNIDLCRRIMEHAAEIHLGETQAILLAREINSLILMDESCGRAFAETWGLKVRGTVYLILKALREGLLNKDEAKEAVSSMINKGLRIEPKLLTRILKEIERFVPSNTPDNYSRTEVDPSYSEQNRSGHRHPRPDRHQRPSHHRRPLRYRPQHPASAPTQASETKPPSTTPR